MPVAMARGFDHPASDLVDVFANDKGEFVQVWNRPFGEPGRKLLLTYQRTAAGPADVTSNVHLEEGPYRLIETSGHRRTLYYRDRPEHPRYEEILPSGRLLVEDFRNGLIVDRVFTANFDRQKRKPKGRKLGDRAVLRRQTAGETWFLSHYQERWDGEELIEKKLVLVVEHRGREVVASSELDDVEGEPEA